MGFSAKITKASGDGSIDPIAYNNELILYGKYIIQCKHYVGSVYFTNIAFAGDKPI